MWYTVRILLFAIAIQYGQFSGRLAFADPPNPERLRISEWARNPMLADPVALSFDHQGGLYVVESARRSTVDIDISAHKPWLLEDLASNSFDSMPQFFSAQDGARTI